MDGPGYKRVHKGFLSVNRVLLCADVFCCLCFSFCYQPLQCAPVCLTLLVCWMCWAILFCCVAFVKMWLLHWPCTPIACPRVFLISGVVFCWPGVCVGLGHTDGRVKMGTHSNGGSHDVASEHRHFVHSVD